ncbi:MAG: hypothetical protein AB7E49_03530 [Campylobacterales bacterium]
MRIFLILSLLSTLLFAYKDAFYLGLYHATQNGGGSSDKMEHDLQSQEGQMGFRFGWDQNSDETHLSKTRYEFAYEKRALEYTRDGAATEGDGYRLSASASWGYNVDWLLTDEIVPFFRLGIGAGEMETMGNGTDLSLGLGVAYVTRRFEVLAGIDREFWQLSGTRFPFSNLTHNDAIVHNFHVGVNVRF